MATEAQIYAFCLLLFPFLLFPFPFCEAGIFTTVESALQISSFMQNKPNFRKSQMSVSTVLTVAYEYKSNWTLGENKPNTNPIKPNFSLTQTPQFPSPAPSTPWCSSEKPAYLIEKNLPQSAQITQIQRLNTNNHRLRTTANNPLFNQHRHFSARFFVSFLSPVYCPSLVVLDWSII